MRGFFVALFFILTAVGCQSLAVAQIDLPQADPARIEAHINFLADDLLNGRDTGTEGYDIAARYVASQFAQIGVLPAGNNSTYFQDITFRRAYRDLEAASMVVHSGNSQEVFAFGDEFTISAPMSQTQMEVTAPLVFVGYGIESDWLDHHDYEGLDVSGKIVVVLSGKPASFPSEEGAHFSSSALKSEVAASKGAVGMIVLWTPTSNQVTPFESLKRTLHQPAVSFLNRDGTTGNSSPSYKGRVALSLEAGARLFALGDRSLGEIFEAMERDEVPQGFELPLSVTLESKSRHESISSPNVLGIIEGSDPVLKNEYVTFTAHLDHVAPAQGEGDEDIIHNGALDNAAGVAALLENARLLMSLPERPKRSIMFAIVTAEEKGLLGSQFFAENPTVPIQNIVANVNLDMPLILYPFSDVIAFGAQHSTLEGSANRALQAMGLTLLEDPMPEQAIFVRSDHYRFVQQGVPSIMLATGYGSEDPDLDGEQIWNDFFENHYHQVSDSVELPINYEAGARFAQVNFMIGLEVANAAQRPQWNEGDFFGNEFGKERAR